MKKSFLWLALLCSTVCNTFSQASLAAENQISDMVVTVNNTLKTYTVVRDEKVLTQWYYIPNAIRFADNVTADGHREPKISIVKYQYKDRNKGDSIFEGGNMEFSVTFAAEPSAIEQMLSNLRVLKGDNKIQLACLPLKSSTLSFINRNKTFLGEGYEPKEELGPLMASQELSFSLPLTAIGADVFEAMVKNAGFAMNAKVHYNGIMPPCGFEVKGVWENLYKYFSKHESLAVDAGWMGSWWGFGGSYKSSMDSIKRSLTNSANIKVTSLGCPSTSDDSIMDKHLAMIIAKLKYEPFNDSTNKMMDTLLLNNAFKTDVEKRSSLRVQIKTSHKICNLA